MSDKPEEMVVMTRSFLAHQLDQAWQRGVRHAWAASNDCGYNGECDPENPPLEGSPYRPEDH